MVCENCGERSFHLEPADMCGEVMLCPECYTKWLNGGDVDARFPRETVHSPEWKAHYRVPVEYHDE